MKRSLKAHCFLAVLWAFSSSASAVSLRDIMQGALQYDPRMEAARATIAEAENQTEISKAGHLPIISLNNTNVLAQKHRYNSARRSGPAVHGRVNLYSWGAVESEIARDKLREDLSAYRLAETRETIGKDIGTLYLTALRAKENIKVYKESLQRHNKLISDLKIITTYDIGRMSEMNEAVSRRAQVESTLLQQERTMYNALNRLSRYTRVPLTESDLSDPFAKVSAVRFITDYNNPDVTSNPSYKAQQKESESAKIDVDVINARRKPAINLEGSVSRHEREIYLGVQWDLYNPASKYQESKSYYSQKVAEARLQEIELDVAQKSQTAESEMLRNEQIIKASRKQIEAQKKVVKDTELQFQIATKSLFNVLDEYQSLTNVQASEVAARNDFRDAALDYLVSQARITRWAGLPDEVITRNMVAEEEYSEDSEK